MKVAVIIAGNLWFSPYVDIYTRILDAQRVQYTLISWNRDGQDGQIGIQYQERIGGGSASIGAYRRYARFVKTKVKKGGFDRLIVSGPLLVCLLSGFLMSWKGDYIIDYRDPSIEQKIGFRQLFALMLKRSYANVISSPGYMRCLPKREYFISHNFDEDKVNRALVEDDKSGFNMANGIDVLTIGGIRNYDSNIEVVKALSNLDDFRCRFVGKSIVAQQIQAFCTENHIKNTQFHGFYPKEEEPTFVRESTFLNIFFPRVITHDTLMSNRLYLSLIYKRPMIVTKDTTQGDYVEQYGVGIAIKDCKELPQQLTKFVQSDFGEYAQRCNSLLKEFLEEQQKFKNMVIRFVAG